MGATNIVENKNYKYIVSYNLSAFIFILVFLKILILLLESESFLNIISIFIIFSFIIVIPIIFIYYNKNIIERQDKLLFFNIVFFCNVLFAFLLASFWYGEIDTGENLIEDFIKDYFVFYYYAFVFIVFSFIVKCRMISEKQINISKKRILIIFGILFIITSGALIFLSIFSNYGIGDWIYVYCSLFVITLNFVLCCVYSVIVQRKAPKMFLIYNVVIWGLSCFFYVIYCLVCNLIDTSCIFSSLVWGYSESLLYLQIVIVCIFSAILFVCSMICGFSYRLINNLIHNYKMKLMCREKSKYDSKYDLL